MPSIALAKRFRQDRDYQREQSKIPVLDELAGEVDSVHIEKSRLKFEIP